MLQFNATRTTKDFDIKMSLELRMPTGFNPIPVWKFIVVIATDSTVYEVTRNTAPIDMANSGFSDVGADIKNELIAFAKEYVIYIDGPDGVARHFDELLTNFKAQLSRVKDEFDFGDI